MSKQLEFRPAAKEPLRPKVLLYGDKGTTKTLTTLRVAKLTGGRLALIDTEHGSDTFAKDFGFDVIRTDDPVEVEGQVDGLLEDPRDFTTFSIDPITQVHDRLVGMADAELRAKRFNQGRKPGLFEPVLEFGTHSRIGHLSKILQAKIRRLDLAVIVTAHLATAYRTEQRGPKTHLVETGSKPEGHKSLGYWYDLVIKLERFGTRIVGRVEKARGMPIAIGDTIEEFDAAKLVALFPEGAFTRRAVARPVVTDEVRERIEELIEELELEPYRVSQALTRYGASSVDLLGRDDGERVVTNLTTALEARRKAKR